MKLTNRVISRMLSLGKTERRKFNLFFDRISWLHSLASGGEQLWYFVRGGGGNVKMYL